MSGRPDVEERVRQRLLEWLGNTPRGSFARLVGMSSSVLSLKLSGQRPISIGEAEVLASALGRSLADLFAGGETPPQPRLTFESVKTAIGRESTQWMRWIDQLNRVYGDTKPTAVQDVVRGVAGLLQWSTGVNGYQKTDARTLAAEIINLLLRDRKRLPPDWQAAPLESIIAAIRSYWDVSIPESVFQAATGRSDDYAGERVGVIRLPAAIYDQVAANARFQAAAGAPIAFVREDFPVDYLYTAPEYTTHIDEQPYRTEHIEQLRRVAETKETGT
jgi:hypothetical protein